MKKVYVYVDRKMRVVYCDFVDSSINRANSQLQPVLTTETSLGTLVRYYGLRLHPNVKFR